MSDPFQSPAKDQLYREAQYGLAVLTCLLALFVYLAIQRISGQPRNVPEHVLNAPVAMTIQPDGSPHGYSDSDQPTIARRLPTKRIVGQVPTLPTPKTQRQPSQVRVASAIEPIGQSTDQMRLPGTPFAQSNGHTRLPQANEVAETTYAQPVTQSSENEFQARADKASDPPSQNRIAQAAEDLEKALESLGNKRTELESAYHQAHRQIAQAADNTTGSDGPHAFASERPITNDSVRSKLAEPLTDPSLRPQPASTTTPKQASFEPASFEPLANQFPNASMNRASPPKTLDDAKNDFDVTQTENTQTENTESLSPESSVGANEFAGAVNPLPNVAASENSFLPLPKISPPTQRTIDAMDNGFAVPATDPASRVNELKSEPEIKPARPLKDQATSVLDKEPQAKDQFSATFTSRPPRQTEPSDALEITSRANDNFYALAQQHYDDGSYFRALYRHNHQNVPSFNHIPAGTKLSIPSEDYLRRHYADLCPAEDPESVLRNGRTQTGQSAAERMYQTKGGETLYDIAREQLGQASRYLELMQINEEWLEAGTDHLTRLPSGLRLVLPPKSLE